MTRAVEKTFLCILLYDPISWFKLNHEIRSFVKSSSEHKIENEMEDKLKFQLDA